MPIYRLVFIVGLFVVSSAVRGEEADTNFGADLDQLLTVLAKVHPVVNAAKHSGEAAANQAIVAGSLEDPQFGVRFEDINAPDGVPNRFGSVYYDLSQNIPLGGKRGARKAVAEVDVDRAKQQGAIALADLQQEMKLAYARRYLALEGERLTKERISIARNLVELTRTQLEQGFGTQQDALLADIEMIRIKEDLVNAERDQQKEAAKINILLGRPANAPLAAPKSLSILPGQQALGLEVLLERVINAAPDLGLSRTDILAAERERDLAQRNWWPDINVRGTIVQGYGRSGYTDGYEAQIGLNLPLQWGVRRAAEHAATEKLLAARDQQEEMQRSIAVKLQDSYWGLVAANKHEKILREELLPGRQAAIENARNSYSTGQASINDVLLALRSLKEAEQDHLKIRLEQQERLAELERFVGGTL